MIFGTVLAAMTTGCGKEISKGPQASFLVPSEVFDNPYMAPDNILGHFHKPNLNYHRTWEEHPLGEFIFTTNNFGFVRRQAIVREKTPGVLRVLMTGDSHVEGVVSVEENVAAELEGILNSIGVKAEVLNAGVGYYLPHHYAAILDKFGYLEPDWFVVIPYAGNDFIGALQAEQNLGRLQLPDRSPSYLSILKNAEKKAARGSWPAGMIYQGLNQVYFFTHHPEYQETALKIFKQQMNILIEMSRQRGIKVAVAVLPTKLDLEYESDREHLDVITDTLGLTRTDLQINVDLTSELTVWMEEQNVCVIDLAEPFRHSEVELYWRRDYHLNHNGHSLLARELAGAIDDRCYPSKSGQY